MSDTAFIKDAQGNYYTIPVADLPDAYKAGATDASAEEVQQNQLQTKYGGLGDQALAAATSALDVPTVGMASGALGAFGDDDWKNEIRGAQAANPWSSAAGTFGGAALTALLTGGGSLAEEGAEGGLSLMAKLAGGPAEALSAIGDTGAGVARSALGDGVLGRAAGGIVKGAVVGGGYGAGSQVSEDSLGDTDTTAEKIIAAIGHGALIGGAAGGAFDAVLGGAGRGLLDTTRARAGDFDALAEKEFGHAAPGVGSAIKAYARAAGAVSGAEPETIESLARDAFGSPAAEGRQLRTLLADNGEAYQDQAARDIRQAGDEMLASDKLISAEARGELKAGYVRSAVKTGNEAETKAWALGQIDSLIGGAQETLDAGGGYTKAIEHASTAAYRAKAAIEDAGDNATVFSTLDNMKRDLQKLTRNSYQTLVRMADPIDQRAAKLTTEWLDKSANMFRDGLEDENLWGKAAVDQKTINAEWTKQIDASKRFHAALTTEIGRDPSNPYLQIRGIDPGKASSYVRGIVNPDKDLTHKAVKDYIQSTQALAGAIARSYELPEAATAEVSKLADAAGRFSDRIRGAEKALTFVNQFRALKSHSEGIGGHAAMVGAILGGPVGAAIGGAADMLGRPAKQIERLAALERLQDKINGRLGRVGDSLESRSIRFERSHALDVTPGRESFEESAKNLRTLTANPAALQSSIGRSLDAIATAAPRIASSIAMRSTAMVQFLASSLPPGVATQDDSLNPKWSKPAYSDSEMRDWQHLAAALHDPLTTLEQGIKGGTLTPKEAGAIKQFYPKIYGEVVADLHQRLMDMEKPPSREKRLTLSTLFDIPTDSDLTQGVPSALQSLYTTPAPPEDSTGSGAPKQMSVNYAAKTTTPGQEAEDGARNR